MNRQKRRDQIIREIRNRYGDVINLETSPLVLIEIIRNYRNVFDDDDGGGGGGGVSPGTSTVAVAGPDSPPTPPSPPSPPESERFESEEILKALLKLQKQVNTLDKKLDRLAPSSSRSG